MRQFATAALLLVCAILGACTTDSNEPTAPTPAVTPGEYTAKFGTTTAGLDLSACNVTIPGGICRRVFTIDATGEFKDTLLLGTATGIIQFDGKITPSGMTATLKCVSTPGTGAMAAALNGTEYVGVATFSGKTIALRVVKGNVGC
jgi:hypothetical protein